MILANKIDLHKLPILECPLTEEDAYDVKFIGSDNPKNALRILHADYPAHNIPDEPRCGPMYKPLGSVTEIYCKRYRPKYTKEELEKMSAHDKHILTQKRSFCYIFRDPKYVDENESSVVAAHVDYIGGPPSESKSKTGHVYPRYVPLPKSMVRYKTPGKEYNWVFQPKEKEISEDKNTKTWLQCEIAHDMDYGKSTFDHQEKQYYHPHGYILSCWERKEKLGFGWIIEDLETAITAAVKKKKETIVLQ